MPHVLRREEHGIVIKLLQILAGQLLQWPAVFRKCFQAFIVSARIRRQISAAMGSANSQLREKIESAILNQVRERESRLKRMADYIIQIAVPLQPSFVYRRS